MADGECIGAYCLTEPHAGSDAASIRTSARRTDSGWVLRGDKVFITSAPQAGAFVVFSVSDPDARTSARMSAFVVERDAPGLSIGAPEHKLGLHASHTASVAFSDVEVPEDALLGTVGGGFGIAMALLDGGRIGIAAQAVGIAQAALQLALRWASEREQFGQPIGQFQAIQQRLADMSTEISAARLLVRQAAQLSDAGQDYTRAASEAKLFASQVANRAASSALQVFGGYGYLRDYDVERLFRDARITELYEGTTEVQRMVIARRLLQEHASAVGSSNGATAT
jgi:alkylation response protein AidB-like acyl-CoA dehydrogenase